jgi:hypothetical protein
MVLGMGTLGLMVTSETITAVVVAVVPGLLCVAVLGHRFRNVVDVRRLVKIWVVTSFYMVLLGLVAGVVVFVSLLVIQPPSLSILVIKLQGHVVSGVGDEVIKYLAVSTVLWGAPIVRPRALLVYGVCAGAALGTAENLMFSYHQGIPGALMRALTAVPMNCVTGMMIGVHMEMGASWYRTLLMPIVLHGTFNTWVFMVGARPYWLFATMTIVVAGLVYVRRLVSKRED